MFSALLLNSHEREQEAHCNSAAGVEFGWLADETAGSRAELAGKLASRRFSSSVNDVHEEDATVFTAAAGDKVKKREKESECECEFLLELPRPSIASRFFFFRFRFFFCSLLLVLFASFFCSLSFSNK